MTRRARGFVLLLATASSIACGRAGFIGSDNGGGSPTVPSSPTPTPIAGISPVPTYGDGHDGALTLSSDRFADVCHGVVVAASGNVTVTSANGIAANDAVLLWQVTDDLPDQQGAGTLASLGSAGTNEIVRVAAVNGNQLQTGAFTGSYTSTAGRRAQVCRVPEYSTLDIPAGVTVRARAWSGSGGIVVFLVSTSLTLNGTIDATARGFRAGNTGPTHGGGNSSALNTTDNRNGGGKGEGLDGTAVAPYGLGNNANGGGGGNVQDGSGGGGSNAAAGGAGGSTTIGGQPGRAVPLLLDELVPGGGGGAAQNGFGFGTAGGAGGGVIYVRAATAQIAGTLAANGSSGVDAVIPGNAGGAAGGGGSGGTIRVIVGAGSTISGALYAGGGRGGHASRASNGNNGRPGGGGGGGGFVRVSGATASGPCDVTGGSPGSLRTGPAPGTLATPTPGSPPFRGADSSCQTGL